MPRDDRVCDWTAPSEAERAALLDALAEAFADAVWADLTADEKKRPAPRVIAASRARLHNFPPQEDRSSE